MNAFGLLTGSSSCAVFVVAVDVVDVDDVGGDVSGKNFIVPSGYILYENEEIVLMRDTK